MIKLIRLFDLNKISLECQGIRAYPHSTTGIGASVYADGIEAQFLIDASSGKLRYHLAVFIAQQILQQIDFENLRDFKT